MANLIGEALKAFDDRQIVLCVFLDLRKAFDTVSHHKVLTKLHQLGVKNIELKWFTSYLENRKQFVEIDGYTSETRMVETGVPQGSLLAVILFQCFIDSLPCTLRYCQSILYADDTTIFLMGKSLKFLRTKVQKDLDNVCGWLNAHELKLNVAKSKVMLLNAKGLCPNVELIMNNEILEVVEKFKFLGVTVDVTLNFDEHYGLLHNKLVKSVFIIRTLAKTLPRSLTDSSTPNSQVIEAFSLCMFLFCTFYQTLPSGPPCSEQQGHQLQARHKIQCL